MTMRQKYFPITPELTAARNVLKSGVPRSLAHAYSVRSPRKGLSPLYLAGAQLVLEGGNTEGGATLKWRIAKTWLVSSFGLTWELLDSHTSLPT